MAAPAGLFRALSTGLDAYKNQIESQNQIRLQNLNFEQERAKLQYLQQQAQAQAIGDKLAIADVFGQIKAQQPQPGAYSVKQTPGLPNSQQVPQGAAPPQPQGGMMGGLPFAQQMPQQPPPQGMAPQGSPQMLRPPMQGGGQPQMGGSQPQPGGAPQQPQQDQGQGGLPPPPTVESIARSMAKTAADQGINIRDPRVQQQIIQAARTNLPAARETYKDQVEAWKNQQTVNEHQTAQKDREQFHEDTEADRAATRAASAQAHADNVATRNVELALERQRLKDEEGKGWSLFTGQDKKTYRVNANTGEVKPLDEAPQGLSKIGSSGGQPRSGSALAVQKFMQEHPDATAHDIQNFLASGAALSKSARDWATGPQGNTVRSLNVAVSHSDTLAGLVDALGNGDVKALNNLKQKWTEQTGGAAPTNFDEAKNIVGDEIVKAVLGSGAGSVNDRQAIQDSFNKASSPEQLRGVIRTAENLMGSQLGGLRDQYKRTTGADDFDESFLSSRTRSVLGSAADKPAGKGAPAQVKTDADYAALPSGAEFIAPDGSHRKKP